MPKNTQPIDLATLYEITRALASSDDLRKCLEESLTVLAERTNLGNGAVTIANPLTGQIETEVAPGMTAEARKRGIYKFGEGITGRVVASGSPIVVPQISQEPLFLNKTRARAEKNQEALSFLCVPIKHGANTIGALSVDRNYHEGLDFEKDLQFLTVLSGLIAQTVVRIQAVNQERERLEQENTQLRRELSEKYRVASIVSNSNRMQEVFEMIHRVADSNATILLRGESGTGKTMVAKAIHHNSKRAKAPFVAVNCSALPETLLECELFGHEKGAFTGAQTAKKGRFELAEGGTLFLDEIGEMSQTVQIKLLNVVQDREFQRLGGIAPIKCNVRLITATNRDLEKAVEEGSFREDLYYRLNVFPIYLPPSAGTPHRHHAPGRFLPPEIQRGKQQADPPHLHPGHRPAGPVPLAGQRAGAAKLHGAGGADLRRGFDQELPSAAVAANLRFGERARQPGLLCRRSG